MKQAVAQAKEGCTHILGKMLGTISEPNKNLAVSAPRIFSRTIHKDKIRDIIGPGGKIIKDICEKSGAKINIDDDGKISVFASNEDELSIAQKLLNDILAEPEDGSIYKGLIVKIMEFGAFVKFVGNCEGLVHISEISDRKIHNVTDVLSQGEMVNVKYLGMDNRGKYKLTMKGVEQDEDFTNKESWKNMMKDSSKTRTTEGGGHNKQNHDRKPSHYKRSNNDRKDNDMGGGSADFNKAHRAPKTEGRPSYNKKVKVVNTKNETGYDYSSTFQKAKKLINKVLKDF
jgi:predicted RNA-binding protein with RPS1 domain